MLLQIPLFTGKKRPLKTYIGNGSSHTDHFRLHWGTKEPKDEKGVGVVDPVKEARNIFA